MKLTDSDCVNGCEGDGCECGPPVLPIAKYHDKGKVYVMGDCMINGRFHVNNLDLVEGTFKVIAKEESEVNVSPWALIPVDSVVIGHPAVAIGVYGSKENVMFGDEFRTFMMELFNGIELNKIKFPESLTSFNIFTILMGDSEDYATDILKIGGTPFILGIFAVANKLMEEGYTNISLKHLSFVPPFYFIGEYTSNGKSIGWFWVSMEGKVGEMVSEDEINAIRERYIGKTTYLSPEIHWMKNMRKREWEFYSRKAKDYCPGHHSPWCGSHNNYKEIGCSKNEWWKCYWEFCDYTPSGLPSKPFFCEPERNTVPFCYEWAPTCYVNPGFCVAYDKNESIDMSGSPDPLLRGKFIKGIVWRWHSMATATDFPYNVVTGSCKEVLKDWFEEAGHPERQSLYIARACDGTYTPILPSYMFKRYDEKTCFKEENICGPVAGEMIVRYWAYKSPDVRYCLNLEYRASSECAMKRTLYSLMKTNNWELFGWKMSGTDIFHFCEGMKSFIKESTGEDFPQIICDEIVAYVGVLGGSFLLGLYADFLDELAGVDVISISEAVFDKFYYKIKSLIDKEMPVVLTIILDIGGNLNTHYTVVDGYHRRWWDWWCFSPAKHWAVIHTGSYPPAGWNKSLMCRERSALYDGEFLSCLSLGLPEDRCKKEASVFSAGAPTEMMEFRIDWYSEPIDIWVLLSLSPHGVCEYLNPGGGGEGREGGGGCNYSGENINGLFTGMFLFILFLFLIRKWGYGKN